MDKERFETARQHLGQLLEEPSHSDFVRELLVLARQEMKRLTPEEERAYCTRMTEGTWADGEGLILANLWQVCLAAAANRNRGLSYDDLLQEGVCGLLLAVQRYVPRENFSFCAAAGKQIRLAIRRALEDLRYDLDGFGVYAQSRISHMEELDLILPEEASEAVREKIRMRRAAVAWLRKQREQTP